ncbi:MAG: hypothetical protein HUU46_15390 [Candidatus Hydrogenedentes bacterium]|nr:hypothetical protein [Candidatus Hydrogenedentota bacterium]
MTLRTCAAIAVLFAAVCGCQTPAKPTPPPTTAQQTLFVPAWNVSTVQTAEGRYPDLFSGGCRAIWIDSAIAGMKREIGPAMPMPEPGIDDDAKKVTDAYIVIECQLETQFADMSVAYDAIRLRGIDVYLETPAGGRIRPMQMRPYGTVKEEPVQALKRFTRTTVMIFPRQDLGAALPVVGADVPAVKLVLDGHDSKYFFEWPGIPLGQTGPRMPTPEEAKYIAKLGYYELFTDIRRLAHIFD